MIDEKISKFLFHKYRITFFPKVTHQVNPLGLEAMLEDNTQHTPCNFMPLGSYSYSQSFFPNVRRIGRYCSIGSNVEVMGASHPTDWISSSPVFYRKRRARMWGSHREDFPDFSDVGDQVEIGDNVWIGDGVLLKRGVNIGTGAIVAARSIVTKNVPPYAIVGGAPARIIRFVYNESTIERVISSRWWEWPVSAWDQIDPRDIEAIVKFSQELRETTPIKEERRIKISEIINRPRTHANR